MSDISIEEALRRAQELQNKVNEALEDTLLEVANETVAEAQARCPVDTGALRRSITHTGVETHGNSMSVTVGSAVEYAPYVEEGHMSGSTFVQGKHMIGDSLALYQTELESRTAQAIEDAFDEVFNR